MESGGPPNALGGPMQWCPQFISILLALQHCVVDQNNLNSMRPSRVLLDFVFAILFGFKAAWQAVQLLNQTFDKKTSWPILLLLLLLHAFGEFKIKFNLMFESTKEERNLCCIYKNKPHICKRKIYKWKMVI